MTRRRRLEDVARQAALSNPEFARLNPHLAAPTRRRVRASSAPSEDAEQTAVIAWAEANAARWPVLEWLFHVPNGGARNAVTGARMKAAGVKRGVPDLCLPAPRPRPDGGTFHGLFIEMKRASRTNHTTPAQRRWLDYLQGAGYQVAVCYGADEAIAALEDYLEGK
jgi:hypothetical protein